MPIDYSSSEPSENSPSAVDDVLASSRVIAETAADAIITIDTNSRILFVNRAATQIFGYTIEEMTNADLTMLMPEYLRHLHRVGFAEYVTSGQKHISWTGVELQGLHKNGHEIALELSFAEFCRNGQRFFTGIARDITRRKQAEHRLSVLQKITDSALAHLTLDDLLPESLNRIREVLNVDTVAILLLRTEGDELVAWAAQGLEEEVRLGVRIPVGVGFAGKIVAQGKPIVIDDVSKAEVFNPLLREKGIKSLLGVPLVVEGRPIGVLHVGTLKFANFTEEDMRLLQLAADRIAMAIENARLYQVERTARTEAEDANRSKDEFLTILSHELRTPLTPIIGWVHMIEDGILPEGEFIRALSIINRNAYGLKRLINDLLDMSAILSGKMRLEETYLSVAEVLSEAIDTMRSYAVEKNVHIEFENKAAGSPAIKGDRSRLNQSLCNILHNAIKFSQTNGMIRVECAATDSEVVITITDQGVGIPAQFLPHVFERFRQADGSRTRAYGGLGLGLALVKSFISAHGGTVQAASEGEGKGSSFIIKLPRAIKAEISHPAFGPQPTAEHDTSRRRLLIVEDQTDTLEMLSEHFRTQGYETVACSSALEALDFATREHFDLLISDIAMPEMDGLQLIRQLRQQEATKNIPAIALTGYASTKDAESALAAGFNLHIPKPIDPTALSATVESLLKQSEV